MLDFQMDLLPRGHLRCDTLPLRAKGVSGRNAQKFQGLGCFQAFPLGDASVWQHKVPNFGSAPGCPLRVEVESPARSQRRRYALPRDYSLARTLT
jgi:hypothetical protein